MIETGLGGRLDATNVIEPVATAITSIDLDHQALLGGTLAAIAREKAGIIKPDVPLVVGPLALEAEREILRTAAEKNAAVSSGRDVPGVRPALRGRHQRDNIRVMVGLADVLKARGIDVPEEALRYAIENVQWPARLELLSDGAHEFLLDAAHNPAGARALAEHLRDAGWTDAALVFGAMADKDAGGDADRAHPGDVRHRLHDGDGCEGGASRGAGENRTVARRILHGPCRTGSRAGVGARADPLTSRCHCRLDIPRRSPAWYSSLSLPSVLIRGMKTF